MKKAAGGFRVLMILAIHARGGVECVFEREIALPFPPQEGLAVALGGKGTFVFREVHWDHDEKVFNCVLADWKLPGERAEDVALEWVEGGWSPFYGDGYFWELKQERRRQKTEETEP